MIDKADIIILYGLSIGRTDMMWWKEITEKVYHGDKYLIYCPYDISQRIDRKDEIIVRNKVLCSTLCDKMDVHISYRDMIFNHTLPIRQNRLFNFGVNDSLREENFKRVYDELLDTF